MDYDGTFMPIGVVPLSAIEGPPSLQLPALSRLHDHIVSIAIPRQEREFPKGLEVALQGCGIDVSMLRKAEAITADLNARHGDPISDTDLRFAVRQFKHAVVAVAQECLSASQRTMVLGGRRSPPAPGNAYQHLPQPEELRVDYEEVERAMRESEQAEQQAFWVHSTQLRHGCGFVLMLWLTVPLTLILEVFFGIETFSTPPNDPELTKSGVLSATLGAVLTASIGVFFYKWMFEGYYSVRPLKAYFVVSVILWLLAAWTNTPPG